MGMFSGDKGSMGDGMSMGPEAMTRRLDMMEMMKQLMMDREGMKSPMRK